MAEENNEPTPAVTPDPVFLVDDTTKEFFEEYVGPGKKYANVGELAKAYANADRHLAEVTKDAGLFKTRAESLEELLMENLAQPNNEPNPDGQPNPTEQQPPAEPPVSAPPKEGAEGQGVDLKARVKEALEEVTQEEKYSRNAKIAEEVSVRHFGSQEDAVKAVAEKAKELDVSPQWIANLAFTSPKAYFATMDIPEEAPHSTSSPAPRSDVDPQRFAEARPGATKPNTYKWFMEQRKADPGKARTQEFQQAILKAAAENPDFYT
jgi:hypothetical protein